jgi:hypothetical protein
MRDEVATHIDCVASVHRVFDEVLDVPVAGRAGGQGLVAHIGANISSDRSVTLFVHFGAPWNDS